MVSQQRTAKALQITGVEQGRLVDVPLPPPGENEVLARRLGIVTCNAFEITIWEGKTYPNEADTAVFPNPPGYPGHEWVAEVEEIGPGVTTLEVGDWVTVCRSNEGRAVMGGLDSYATHIVCHETRLIKVPVGMDLAKLAPAEMAMCMAANILDLKAVNAIEGMRTAVIGLGPAGLIAAQLLRIEGAATVIGFDLDGSRREYALTTGIVDRAIDPTSEEGIAVPLRNRDFDPSSMASLRINPEVAIDVSIECTGSPQAAAYIMDRTRDIFSIFAVPHGLYQFGDWFQGHHRGLKLFGNHSGGRPESEYVIRRIVNGSLDLSQIVSHTMRFGLDEFAQAMELIKAQKALKVLFTLDDDE